MTRKLKVIEATSATGKVSYRYPESRFLPETLWSKTWVDLEDPTALEIGDLVFDPSIGSHYAGRVVEIMYDNRVVEIEWHKSIDNIFHTYERMDRMTAFWWVDPILQEA